MDRSDTLATFESVLEHAWSLLERGAAEEAAGMHHPVIATRGIDDLPNARTVLLWRAEQARRLLYFGTDRRSPKHVELENTPWALLVFYEPAARTQLRLHATVTFRGDDPLTLQAWRDLPLQT